MATRPKNRFTVQEARNLKVHENYSSEQITCAGDTVGIESHWESVTTAFESHSSEWQDLITSDEYTEGTDWIGNGDGPAKSVTIIPYSGDSANIINLKLKIDGTYGDEIKLLFDDVEVIISL